MLPNDMPRFIKVQDAARCLGLTKGTVYDWLARGYLPYHRLGRTIRIAAADLRAHLEATRKHERPTLAMLDAERKLFGESLPPSIPPQPARTDEPHEPLRPRKGEHASPGTSVAA